MKNFIILFLCLFCSINIYAANDSLVYDKELYKIIISEKTDTVLVSTNDFWDNWEVSANIGTAVYTADYDRFMPFEDRFGLSAELALTKWITPGVALRTQYTFNKVKSYVLDYNKYPGYVKTFNYSYLHGDVLFNLNNLIGGYKENRFYSIIPYVGFGVNFMYDQDQEFAGSFGIMQSFQISKKLDANIDIKGTMLHERFDNEVSPKWTMDGFIDATIGLTYKFSPGWKSIKRSNSYISTIAYYQDKSSDLEIKNQLLENELDKIKNTPAVPVIITKEIIKIPTMVINFKIDTWELTKIARVNLGYLAEILNSDDFEGYYILSGYADKHTGSVKRNETLSVERAQAVYDALVNEFGVDPSKLKMEHHGGVDNMYYDDNALSRVVILHQK